MNELRHDSLVLMMCITLQFECPQTATCSTPLDTANSKAARSDKAL